MRIAFFADNFYPELSGIVDSILITGRELAKRGHEVIFVGPYYAPKDWELVKRAPVFENGIEKINGMRVVRLPSIKLPFSPTGQSRLAFPVSKSFSVLDQFKPDIIHTHSPYGTGIEARRAAKRYQVPLVGTNHTPIEEYFPWAPGIMRRFDARYYNHCVQITAPYQHLIERMREVGFKKPGRAMPNPAELSLYTPADDAERKTLRAAYNLTGPTVLFAGRLSADKRVDVLLRGAALAKKVIPNLQVIICGNGIERKKLETLTERLGIKENVLFTGFVPPHKLSKYYRAADMFSIMSTSDSQSLSLMQAHAVGIPSIGARAKGLPDYLPASAGFLVEPGNVTELSKRIIELSNDSALRERMGTAAMEFVARFAPEKIAQEWEDLYTSVLASRSA